MKIAVIGSRGIPNNYGGFEQFAEIVTPLWVEMGHEVICYSPHFHDFNKNILNGVQIKKIFCPENFIGPLAHYLYDYLSLKDAVKNNCDVFLELGYQSSSPTFFLFSKKTRSRIITNMDGMEWMRSKWSPFVKFITRISERIAVVLSGRLISDNEGIANYIFNKYGIKSDVIAYGCETIDVNYKNLSIDWIAENEIYDLIIARLEPENNIHKIIDAFLASNVDKKLIVVGGLSNKYAKGLLSKYANYDKVIFVGSIYDQKKINSLRQHCMLYFHGHSVGGTNPSLIEAMANNCRIIAHDNVFNRSVLGEDSMYFTTSNDLKEIIQNCESYLPELNKYRNANFEKIKINYRWKDIAEQYIDCFERVILK